MERCAAIDAFLDQIHASSTVITAKRSGPHDRSSASTQLHSPEGAAILQSFIARDSMLSAHTLSQFRLSVRPSVCPSHGWISQKRWKLGSCNFHYTVALSLWFLRDKFHREILTGSRAGHQTRVGWGNELFSRFMCQYLGNGTRYVQSYY